MSNTPPTIPMISPSTLIALSARDLHLLIALLGNIESVVHVGEIDLAASDLQRDYPNESAIVGLFRKLAIAHDAVCDGAQFVPIADILADAVTIAEDAISRNKGMH